MSIKTLLLAALCVAISTPVFATGDAAKGKAKAAACVGCHGATGNSDNPLWPKLAGQHAQYLRKQLGDFKTAKTRKDPLMLGSVANLNDADMDNLAAYFATQKTSAGKTNAKLKQRGEKIYRGGNSISGVAACMSCHGPTGAGNPTANFPKVSGQHAAYVSKALNDFKLGERTNDAGKMMQNIAAKMSKQEIEAVAAYMQGLK